MVKKWLYERSLRVHFQNLLILVCRAILFEVRIYFVGGHLTDDSDKLAGVQHTVVITDNKVSYKVIVEVCRRFKIEDDIVVSIRKFGKTRVQHMELSTVIRKFERLYKFLVIRRYTR